jgi:transposase
MVTKSPPEVLTPEDLAYMDTLNECERRQFLATKAISFHTQGYSIRKISKIMEVSKNTIYKGMRELRGVGSPPKGRVRRPGGGFKRRSRKGSRTITSKGLTVNVDINAKTYQIQRPIDDTYEKEVRQRNVFHKQLPKWNYLIKPA